MLDRTSNSRSRHRLHLRRTDPSGQKRILRNILKITPIQRIPVNIHTRSKKRINLIQPKLLPRHLIQIPHQFRIKSTAQQCPIRQRKRLRSTVHTNPGRTIRTTANRNTQLLQRIRDTAKRCRSSRRNLRTAHTLSTEHGNQIFLTNLSHKLIHRNLFIQYIHKLIAFISSILQSLRHLLFPSLLRIYSTHRHLLRHRLISTIRHQNRLHPPELLNRSIRLLQLFQYTKLLLISTHSLRTSHITAHKNLISSPFQNITRFMTSHTTVIIRSHIILRNNDNNFLLLTRIQFPCLRKPDQLSRRISKFPLRHFHINLNNLFTLHITCVGNRRSYRKFILRLLQNLRFRLKISIR